MPVEVQFGRNGHYDPGSVLPILVTDEQHRKRSAAATDATDRAAAARPLPAAAANGGRVGADPNSPAEVMLTEGKTMLMKAARASICTCDGVN